jgi:predicted HTH domain antitoxin
VRKELALTLYQSGAVSEGKAAEIAGLNRFAFSKLLGDRRIERNYGLEDLRDDLEFVKNYKAARSAEKSAAPLKQ